MDAHHGWSNAVRWRRRRTRRGRNEKLGVLENLGLQYFKLRFAYNYASLYYVPLFLTEFRFERVVLNPSRVGRRSFPVPRLFSGSTGMEF